MASTPPPGRHRPRWKQGGQSILWLFGILFGMLLLLVLFVKPAGQKRTPAGYTRNEARYILMSDGVKIAIDIWYPAGLSSGQRLPTVLRPTRYGRAFKLGLGSRLLWSLGIPDPMYQEAKTFNEAGYVLVLMDVRGSGASFGSRPVEWPPEETADIGEVVNWIVAQSWSTGKVGIYGDSYAGVTSELAAGLNHPAIKVVGPRYSSFDPQFTIGMPGGVFNQGFVQTWHRANVALDNNDLCAMATSACSFTPGTCLIHEVTGVKCALFKLVYSGIKPVDADPDGRQMAAAIAGRQNVDVYEAMRNISFRDDLFGDSGKRAGDLAPYGHTAAIEHSGVAMFVWVNWIDAGTAESALSRYLTLSNPQRLIINPLSHSGDDHADPFLSAETPADPPVEEHLPTLIRFFDVYLKEDATARAELGISYYTLGEGIWKDSKTWPPAGFYLQRWYLGPQGTLTQEAPSSDSEADAYTVDWTATTGPLTRWHSQMSNSDIVYPNRAEEDQKLLTYTSAPLETDVEITGNPIITLFVASTESDGAFHVYLEDVTPDGRVTYITEGIIRAIHRQESTEAPPYVPLGPYHSFKRADALPLVPGQVAEIRFSLYPTSVLIRKDHRLRVAIAGHDACLFARYPTQGTPTLTVQRNSTYPSFIELPTRARP